MHPERIREIQTFLERWQHSPLAGDYPLYTGYLRSLADDQRLPAVEQYLRPLIAWLASRSEDERYLFVDAVCACIDWRGHKAGASPVPGMPHELLQQVAIPTLLERRRLRPGEARPHAWLALLPMRHAGVELPTSRELLQEAHRLAPEDEFVIERLADNWLDGVDFACHHLPEALLYPVEEVMGDLGEVRRLAALLPAERRAAILADVERYVREIEGFVGRQP